MPRENESSATTQRIRYAFDSRESRALWVFDGIDASWNAWPLSVWSVVCSSRLSAFHSCRHCCLPRPIMMQVIRWFLPRWPCQYLDFCMPSYVSWASVDRPPNIGGSNAFYSISIQLSVSACSCCSLRTCVSQRPRLSHPGSKYIGRHYDFGNTHVALHLKRPSST